MGTKNKTVSFRIDETRFEELQALAGAKDLSLSTVFREYVDVFVAHDGRVTLAPKHAVCESESKDGFPAMIEVQKSFVREHERLELETDHLREQLNEYRQYATQLKTEVEEREEHQSEVVRLEDLDAEAGTSLFLD